MAAGRNRAAAAETGQMTLRPDLSFFPLDDHLIVFNGASQSLVGLNATAALIVQKLREGVAAAELADMLGRENGVAKDEADGWTASTLEALGSQGLLADGRTLSLPPASSEIAERVARLKAGMPPFAPFKPAARGCYRLLGIEALIRYGHGAQKRMVDSVIGHLKTESTGTPALTIDVQSLPWNEGRQIASNIYCDGEPEASATRLSGLAPLVKSALWSAAVNAHDFLLDLHAGVVGKDGRCILLPAPAGSGKSSLTAALTHSGLGYYSDEVALIERGTFYVSPVPLAICVKSTAWDFMSRYRPELPGLPIHHRDDGKRVRYVRPVAAQVQKEPGQVSHIFFPLYAKDEPTRLVPVARADALARLMDQCLAFRLQMTPGNVKDLVNWISGIDCYALTFSSLDEAVALVRNTAFPE
jgi:hypothetical protein